MEFEVVFYRWKPANGTFYHTSVILELPYFYMNNIQASGKREFFLLDIALEWTIPELIPTTH